MRTTLWTLVIALAACGGSPHRDRYARATNLEQQCCEHLSGAPRDSCLQQIVRVNDPEVARTSTNQAQFACVEEHFACDAHTGRATQASAQQALECIQELQ